MSEANRNNNLTKGFLLNMSVIELNAIGGPHFLLKRGRRKYSFWGEVELCWFFSKSVVHTNPFILK